MLAIQASGTQSKGDSLIRKTLRLWVIVAVVGAVGLLGLGYVFAQQQTGVSRELPTTPVAAGDEFVVTINNVGLADGGIGSIEETLLDSGLTYVDGSAVSTNPDAIIGDDEAVTGVITFTLIAVDSFTYRVAVGPDVGAGPHFSGTLKGFSGPPRTIGGDDSIMVESDDNMMTPGDGTTMPGDGTTPGEGDGTAMPSNASRLLPTAPVAAGDEFVVTINNVGLADGGIGSIEETLLDSGLTYVDGSAVSTNPDAIIGDDEAVTGVITFTLLAVDSFTYRVTVGPDVGDGPHFSGTLKGFSGPARTIGGDDSITVEAPDEPETPTIPVGDASRVLPTGRVAQGAEFAVTINNVGLADGFGRIEETLDSGLTYVQDSAASTTPNAVIGDGDAVTGVITFTLIGVDSFTYGVTVGADVADGPYVFSGLLTKLSGDPTTIAGDSSVTVGTPAPSISRPSRPRAPASRPRTVLRGGLQRHALHR